MSFDGLYVNRSKLFIEKLAATLSKYFVISNVVKMYAFIRLY